MKKDNNYWEPVYEMFFNEYPELGEKMVDWYPCGQMEITVKVEDGTKYVYDMLSHMVYVIRNVRDEDMSEADWRREFARNLNRKLHNVGMTQGQIAEITGISAITINKYFNGKATPSSFNLRKIARALHCSVSELVDI